MPAHSIRNTPETAWCSFPHLEFFHCTANHTSQSQLLPHPSNSLSARPPLSTWLLVCCRRCSTPVCDFCFLTFSLSISFDLHRHPKPRRFPSSPSPTSLSFARSSFTLSAAFFAHTHLQLPFRAFHHTSLPEPPAGCPFPPSQPPKLDFDHLPPELNHLFRLKVRATTHVI